MKEKLKNFLKNIITVFISFFSLISLYSLKESFIYYSAYEIEELREFLNIRELLTFTFSQALFIASCQIPISSIILLILENFKIKNAFKIIITFIVTFFIGILIFLTNFSIQF